ncbi:MAG: hypothetical protein FWG30_01915 [Eubacteriaceae bacterium]|nr:hypothetical protein [Eubacteriaceae bacterium]
MAYSWQRKAVCAVLLALLTLIASCSSFDREETKLPDIAFKRPNSWYSIREPDSYIFYSDNNELKASVSVNRYLNGSSLSEYMEEVIGQPEGSYITDVKVLSQSDSTISGQAAKEYAISGNANGTAFEYRIIGFIAKKNGYVFVFSQENTISTSNNEIINRMMRSISLKD